MSSENPEIRKDKITHRTMGEYSIAKSFKGILRVAHIMELVDGETDYFLSPTYFGKPKHLMNISGGTYKSKEYGYQTAIKAMQTGGGINRYEFTNPRIGNDKLRLNRVPMTDSMGNYLNWNLGTDGVTIGSNEDINGNYYGITHFKQYQGEKDFQVYQPVIFPILESRDITIGFENKIYKSNKKGINHGILSIEGGTEDAMLIVENLYDVSQQNKTVATYYRTASTGEREEVETGFYKNIVDGIGQKYSKLRTIYKNTKDYPQEYDAFMFRQNDYDVDNYNLTHTDPVYKYDNDYNQNICDKIKDDKPVRDSIVDMVNLKDYVKSIIQKYMKGNVIEVPSGAVIWQYCSLEKWRAHTENSLGNATNLGDGGYPGHRPSLQLKENQNGNPFFSTTIQGVCKKINRLRKEFTNTDAQNILPEDEDPTVEDKNPMTLVEDSAYRREIIPLYKRDYALCDGSKYRLPYSAPLENSKLIPLQEHMDRFFELFFNIGYRYTEREKLQVRPKSKWDSSRNIHIPYDADGKNLINEKNINNAVLSKVWFENLHLLPENPPYDSWITSENAKDGLGYPKMISPKDDTYNNCDDLDVLFQEDLATMLTCTRIYEEFKNQKNRLNGKEWTFENVKEWLMTQKLPEEYIFNTFIGDLNPDILKYKNNTNSNEQWYNGNSLVKTAPEVMIIDYNYCPDGQIPRLPIGREVTYFGSPMKFYSAEKQQYIITTPCNLPMVNYFIQLITSKGNSDSKLQMYFYSFYNYDFQVPNFMHNSNTPVMIGSGAFGENDENRASIKKVHSWSSNFSEGDYPHRHGVFLWTGGGNNEQLPGNPNSGFTDSRFYNLPSASENAPVSLISHSGGNVTNLMAAGKHGGTLWNPDGNGNYIIKPVPLINERILGTSYSPYYLLQSDSTSAEYIGWETGTGYTFESSQMVSNNPNKYVNFTEADGNYTNYYNKTENPYSFNLMEDPRFENAEPNRGLTGPPEYVEGQRVVKYKDEDALMIFPDTEDINWFTPENIQMLPLIKL